MRLGVFPELAHQFIAIHSASPKCADGNIFEQICSNVKAAGFGVTIRNW
jgi:hypothetical protein